MASSLRIDTADAVTGPRCSHSNRLPPRPGSITSSPSSTSRHRAVSNPDNRTQVSSPARSRAAATRFRIVTTPGRTTLPARKKSHAAPNTRRVAFHRPSRQELVDAFPIGTIRRTPPEMRDRDAQMLGTGLAPAAIARQHRRVHTQHPASRATASTGAASTSSGTNPNHSNVANCTANPNRF